MDQFAGREDETSLPRSEIRWLDQIRPELILLRKQLAEAMTTGACVAVTETVSTKRQAKGLSKFAHGAYLFATVIFTFNAGMFATLGLRHGSPTQGSVRMLFLIAGCL